MITGALTEKLELLKIGYSANTIGVSVPFYTPVKKIYASSMNQNSVTGYDNGMSMTDNVTFYCRFDQVLLTDKKTLMIKYNDKLYNVVSVSPVRRTEAIIINCENVE